MKKLIFTSKEIKKKNIQKGYDIASKLYPKYNKLMNSLKDK